ncbi:MULTISPECIES: V-type ATP synthase subunit I [unclassified Haladaptatus]|uniref:V-type ATP synthase subunit I n=1 Tax=unclassified Haladaptatus TaxID=2622732 RepID=UPI0023E7CB4C|nr:MULTISPECIES: V-type ATP synthase subunit I [unclassified Haladaptatus]
MLRPKQMSRVSVTGSKSVMGEVIETVHDLNMVHLSEYDGAWDGFAPGDPVSGADDASEKLVTVRSIQSILDVDAEDAGPTRIVTDDALEEELEEIRTEVNRLDDRRDELRDELRAVEDRIDTMEPFAALGIDLDLLSGYDSVSVTVGEGKADVVERALLAADDVKAFEMYTSDKAIAVVARLADDATLDDILVGNAFTPLDIPDAEGSPAEYIEELRHRAQQLRSKLNSVESEIESLKLDAAGFLLAAEERLSIDVQKREAPLTFATTENAFVAEGWVPTERYSTFASALKDAVGDHVEIDELERADYDEEGHAHATEPAKSGAGAAATDGGTTMGHGNPPVIQDNPAGTVKPFEALTGVINRPKYSELDPTVILFLTFPAFFGFMIGDLGYGLIYMGLGYLIYSRFENEVVKSLGGIAMWAGGFTALFGILYGEIFGLHQLGEIVWAGHPPIHKGLQPEYADYASTWLVLSLLLGLAHMTIGYIFGFVDFLSHGVKDAVLEKGSWVVLMLGVWGWIFSQHAADSKPEFMFTVFNGQPFALGFGGFSEATGLAMLGVAGIGLVMLLAGEGAIGLLESLNVVVNVLSYTRIAAVLLAKAGMAFVVNLLVFGAYVHDGAFHLIFFSEKSLAEIPAEEVMFAGMLNGSSPTELLLGAIAGLVILVIGHLLVLVLGITSAGLQAVRLEYVEFFGKFYEGGGEKYQPFGYERTYTTED